MILILGGLVGSGLENVEISFRETARMSANRSLKRGRIQETRVLVNGTSLHWGELQRGPPKILVGWATMHDLAPTAVN